MIILTLDTKKCMSSLLLSEAFDHFFFIEGEITTFGKFTMDGYMQKDFFEEPPQQSYAFWKDIRPYCFKRKAHSSWLPVHFLPVRRRHSRLP